MSNRKAIIFKKSTDGKRAIGIDKINSEAILEYINQSERHRSKFQDICNIILGGHKNCKLYDKEDINERCKHVYAMKLFKGGDNDRIYCKQISIGNKIFVVIAAELHVKKKTQKNSSKEINIIETVATYEYEIED